MAKLPKSISISNQHDGKPPQQLKPSINAASPRGQNRSTPQGIPSEGARIPQQSPQWTLTVPIIGRVTITKEKPKGPRTNMEQKSN